MAFLLTLASLISFLSFSDAQAATYWGKRVSVGKGYAQTYIEVNNKKLESFGIGLSPSALKGLPHHMKEYQLPLPNYKVSPYKLITIDWNPQGHEPGGVYDRPHFDYHFYLISNTARKKISCQGNDAAICIKNPEERKLPSNYAPTPEGVPQMGWHWVDLLSPEFNGGIFTRTFIYGYYDGGLIFIEPMVTTEYLKSKVTSHNNIRQPELYPFEGEYPSSYKVFYDQTLKLHKVELTNFNRPLE